MPYKNPEAKSEWERQHRPQRLARRRELRRIEAERKEAQPKALGGAGFLPPTGEIAAILHGRRLTGNTLLTR